MKISRTLIECDFEPVKIEDFKLIQTYLDKAQYVESNHNICNMYIWLDYYPLFKYVDANYLLLLGIHENEFFVYMPLCDIKYAKQAILKAYDIFQSYNQPFNLSCYTKEMMDIVLELFPDYHACARRSLADYIYETEKFRDFSGKKLQKKRNHLNAFKNEYHDRYNYEDLDASNIDECIDVLNHWKTNDDSALVHYERQGVINLLHQFNNIPYKGGVMRVDGQVEGFLIVSVLQEQMIQENVEKCNHEIRGLNLALQMEFFKRHYLDYEYLNREDDLGLENLRKSKLSFNPVSLLEKYWLCKGD